MNSANDTTRLASALAEELVSRDPRIPVEALAVALVRHHGYSPLDAHTTAHVILRTALRNALHRSMHRALRNATYSSLRVTAEYPL